MTGKRLFALAILMAWAGPALGNDSTAQLGAGGLQLVRTDAIELLSEDLYVSAREVRVAYHFRNKTTEPVTYLVAFPLPVIDAIVPEAMNVMLPDSKSDNFVDFTITVDGKPVTPSIEARATALGQTRPPSSGDFGLPLNPIADGLYDTLGKAPAAMKAELNRLGMDLHRLRQCRSRLEARDHVLLGTDLPAGTGARRRAHLQIRHRLRLLWRLCSRGPDLQGEILHRQGLRCRSAEQARADGELEHALPQRTTGELHPHHRQQLGGFDRAFPPSRRQGRSRRAGQLLRHSRQEDLTDPIRDDRGRLHAGAGARGPDRGAGEGAVTAGPAVGADVTWDAVRCAFEAALRGAPQDADVGVFRSRGKHLRPCGKPNP